MLSIESLLISIFTFFEKLIFTLFSIGIRTKAFVSNVLDGRKQTYLDSRVYVGVAVLSTFALAYRPDGIKGPDTFFAWFSATSSQLTDTKMMVYVIPVSLFLYAAVYLFGKLYQLDEPQFSAFIDCGLYWMGTYIFGYMVGSAVMITSLTLSHHRYLDELPHWKIIMAVILTIYFGFFLLKPIIAAGVLRWFSKDWLKFSSITLLAPAALLISGYTIISISAQVQKEQDAKRREELNKQPQPQALSLSSCIRNDKLFYTISPRDRNGNYEMVVKLRVFNPTKDRYFLEKAIQMKKVVELSRLRDTSPVFKAVFQIESPLDIVPVDTFQIANYYVKAKISESQRYLLNSTSGGLYVEIKAERYVASTFERKSLNSFVTLYEVQSLEGVCDKYLFINN